MYFIFISSSGDIRAVASLTIPGGQEFHFPHFFISFQSIFLIFPQTLLTFFLILALRVGESPTREGRGYATWWYLSRKVNHKIINDGNIVIRFMFAKKCFFERVFLPQEKSWVRGKKTPTPWKHDLSCTQKCNMLQIVCAGIAIK